MVTSTTSVNIVHPVDCLLLFTSHLEGGAYQPASNNNSMMVKPLCKSKHNQTSRTLMTAFCSLLASLSAVHTSQQHLQAPTPPTLMPTLTNNRRKSDKQRLP
jgi:hypothetical protein